MEDYSRGSTQIIRMETYHRDSTISTDIRKVNEFGESSQLVRIDSIS
jgi:hypothetical protein